MIRTILLALMEQMAVVNAVAADVGVTTPQTSAQKKAAAPSKISREAVVVYYDNTEPSIEFSAQELQKTLSAVGHKTATLKPLARDAASPDPVT